MVTGPDSCTRSVTIEPEGYWVTYFPWPDYPARWLTPLEFYVLAQLELSQKRFSLTHTYKYYVILCREGTLNMFISGRTTKRGGGAGGDILNLFFLHRKKFTKKTRENINH